MADKAAKNASGQATDGALTATVTPEYRKWREVTARRANKISRLLLYVANEHRDIN
jgi:hypothetical protein